MGAATSYAPNCWTTKVKIMGTLYTIYTAGILSVSRYRDKRRSES